MYPTAEGFHDGTDERRDRFTGNEWVGIDSFLFRSAQLSLLAVSDRVIDLAETLLAESDLRISSAEANSGRRACCPGPRRTGLLARPNWYPRERSADADADAGSRPPEARISTMPGPRRRPGGHGRRLGAGNLPPRHRADLAPRRPLHDPPRLPAGPRRVGRADALGQPQLRTRVVPVRAPGDATAARALRLPAARSPVLDRRHPHRHGATVSPAGYDPVAAGAARRSVTRRERNRPNLDAYRL
jgi:hypothetical protein